MGNNPQKPSLRIKNKSNFKQNPLHKLNFMQASCLSQLFFSRIIRFHENATAKTSKIKETQMPNVAN